MTTHLTKIWWDLNKDKLVEQLIPESEIYKREWVGLTEEEIWELAAHCWDSVAGRMQFARAIEATLTERTHE
jgi:hypothetical protein